MKKGLGSNLLLGAQTPGADVNPLLFAVYYHGSLGDIRQPSPPGMALGMRYIISNHRFLSTQLTLQRLLL
jgi:hypothetical protein